jgi:hypothetical protein
MCQLYNTDTVGAELVPVVVAVVIERYLVGVVVAQSALSLPPV